MSPKKKAQPQSAASSELLELNSELHQHMAAIITGMTTDEGISVIPSAPVWDAAKAGSLATSILKLEAYSGPELVAIEATTAAIEKGSHI
ncbi:hypothetical protein LCGC14_2518660 [marine sediment metagenome]|uniref:Uncharacterized protein n=1 Tax=marine sediment metagenome TaxID=412755 RepID=A0A0F9AXG7_9ZZZZ